MTFLVCYYTNEIHSRVIKVLLINVIDFVFFKF